jgi:hypothetical protein
VSASFEVLHTPFGTGYVLSYKRDHGNWQEVQLDADRTSYVLQSLHCGATYHAYLTAHNKVGNSRTSGIVTAVTKGGGKSNFAQPLQLLEIFFIASFLHINKCYRIMFFHQHTAFQFFQILSYTQSNICRSCFQPMYFQQEKKVKKCMHNITILVCFVSI